MAVFLKKMLPALALVVLAVWVVRYGILWRVAERQDYAVAQSSPGPATHFAGVWYDYGVKAWYQNRLDEAVDHFQKALAINVLHMDAWIRLAQVEAARGRAENAVRMIRFMDDLTRDVVKWKWPQLMLARDLGLDDIFYENINFAILHPSLRDDALQLLDMQLNRDVADVLAALEPGNRPDYLRWLIRWNRVEDSLVVWEAVAEEGGIDDDLYERYARFLLGRQAFRQAAGVRRHYTGDDEGINNPGFEEPLSSRAFGWRILSATDPDIRRVRHGAHDAREGDFSLQATFSGQLNLDTWLVTQIVPVPPGSAGKLSFWWRSRNLTTDKRPFMEIRCLEGRDRPVSRSRMIPPSTDWQQENMVFEIPPDCHAVRISLRRQQSHRFDNRIDGVLLIDDLQMEVLPTFSNSNTNLTN